MNSSSQFTLNNSFFCYFFLCHFHRSPINDFGVCFNNWFYKDFQIEDINQVTNSVTSAVSETLKLTEAHKEIP